MDPGPEMGSLTNLRMKDIEVLEMVNITDADPEMGSFTDIRMWSIGVPDPEMIKGEVQEAMKMLSLNIQVEVLNNLKNFTIIDYVG